MPTNHETDKKQNTAPPEHWLRLNTANQQTMQRPLELYREVLTQGQAIPADKSYAHLTQAQSTTPKEQQAFKTALQTYSNIIDIQWVNKPEQATDGQIKLTSMPLDCQNPWYVKLTGGFVKYAQATPINLEFQYAKTNPKNKDGLLVLNSNRDCVKQAPPMPGNQAYKVMLHELGHNFGLGHAGDQIDQNAQMDPSPVEKSQVSLPAKFNHNRYTVMGYENENYDKPFPITPMILDINVLLAKYKANTDYRPPNDTFKFTDNSHPLSSITPHVYDKPGDVMMTLHSMNPNAYLKIDASSMTTPVTLNLNPGTHSSIGTRTTLLGLSSEPSKNNIGLSYQTDIKQAIGGKADDVLIGKGRSLLAGGQGNDFYIHLKGKPNDVVIDYAKDGFGGDGKGKLLYVNPETGKFTQLSLDPKLRFNSQTKIAQDQQFAYRFAGEVNTQGQLVGKGDLHISDIRSGEKLFTIKNYETSNQLLTPPTTSVYDMLVNELQAFNNQTTHKQQL